MNCFTRWICVAVTIWLLGGCSAVRAPRPGVINHIVIFKLKNPDSIGELLIDCDQQLAKIPGVTSYYAGEHFDIGRKDVDSDYDVVFYAGFKSQKALEEFVAHPVHIRIKSKWEPRLQWMRIYDTIHRERR